MARPPGGGGRRTPGVLALLDGLPAVTLFLLNHTDRPQRVPAAGLELITDEPVDDR